MSHKQTPAGGEGPGSDNFLFREAAAGRILHERFLIERDVTDPSLGGKFLSFVVKDLKDFCRRVVLKIVNDNTVPSIELSFRQVCDVLRELNHPNIEVINETGRLTDGRPFAVTECTDGDLLDGIIDRERRFGLEPAARILEQVAEATAAAHSKNILHCDMRPGNIVVSKDGGCVRVLNFGSAWPVDVRGEGLEGVTSGSEPLFYAAPELLVKLGHRTPASDVYSFAVLAYRLITGFAPFAAADQAGLLAAVKSAPAVLPSDCRTEISGEADKLLLSGLQFEPAWRPPDIEDYAHRLVRAIRPPQGVPILRPQIQPKIEVCPELGPTITMPQPRSDERTVPISAPTAPIFSDRAIAAGLIVLLMAAALSIPVGQLFLKNRTEAAGVSPMVSKPAETVRQIQIRYKIETALARQQPQITFASDAAGEAFVFSEADGVDGRPSYELIYPLDASKVIEPGKAASFTPSGRHAAKAYWFVFTSFANKDLEAIHLSAAADTILNEADGRKLRHFIERGKSVRVDAIYEAAVGETVLKSSGDRIVHRIDAGQR